MNKNNQIYKGNGLNNEQQKNNFNNNNNNNNNNNDIYGLGGLSAPLALGAIQKDVYRGNNGNNSSSIMIDTFGDLSNVSGPLPLGNLGNLGNLSKQQNNFVPLQFGGGGKKLQFDDMISIPSGFEAVHDETVNEEDTDFSEFKSEELFFVPSKCGVGGTNGGMTGLQSAPIIYNDITSMVVDQSPNDVLFLFENILDTFSNEIDYKIDKLNYIINGQIFIRNFQVFFKVSIWNEINNKTRFEVRRTKGDTIMFNEFWNELKQILNDTFKTNMSPNNNSNRNFNLNDLPPIEYNLTLQDLNNFIIDIDECDPSVVYSIAMLLNAFKVQTQFTQTVFNHKEFIKCIIEKALTHCDTALVRGGLITLEILCRNISIASDTLIDSFNILHYVIPLLSFHCQLIQKHSIRLLYQLSKHSNGTLWTLNNQKLHKFAQINVKQCQQKWKNSKFATNDFIQQQMFDNINQKLIKVN